MAGASRAVRSADCSSSVNEASPPSASISGTREGAMNSGSTAIALSAEYGEYCPSAISFSGSSCTKLKPASRIQQPMRMRSGISPMPQLSLEGIENSGTSRPACRPVKKSRGMHALQYQVHTAGERVRLRQQTHDEKGFVREVEEEAGMRHHAVAREEIERERLLACDRRHAQDGGPAAVGREHADARVTLRHRPMQRAVIVAHPIADLIANRRCGREQRRRGNLHWHRDGQVRVANQLEAVR